MPQFARVTLDRAIGREFDYLIPDTLVAQVQIGSRVSVPFGRQLLQGFVTAVIPHSDHGVCKPIESVVGHKPLLTIELLELARWMADYYCCTTESAIKAVMPEVVRKGENFKERLFVTLIKKPDAASLTALEKKAKKQALIIRFLEEQPTQSIFLADLLHRTGTSSTSVEALVRLGVLSVLPEAQIRDPFVDEVFLPSLPLAMNQEQIGVLDLVKKSISKQDPAVILLHGVTGSGKTEIYLQGMEYALKHNMGAIILVPEISLTPQTVERFKSRFVESGAEVAVLHSHLGAGERHDEWHKVLEGKAQIVIGARSAVFAPVKNLGLIIVDEEHESTYKQEETPRYNARDIAVVRGKMAGAAVLLGSATPSLESYHNAERKKYHLCSLPNRVDDKKMPTMKIIDMRQEAMRQKGLNIFSDKLVSAMRKRLERGEQTILFLNRRGYASSMLCPECGHVEGCPNCSVSLTYHRKQEKLMCHLCGHVVNAPTHCTACKSPKVRFSGLGTEKIEAGLIKLFPKARLLRMDSDTMTRKEAYRDALNSFKTGKIDILVGTQMIAKGLHFPNVTLVGIIYADMGLHNPDFRAGEKTFSLLTQVSGRAGRGDVEGEVIVQTFTPSHASIQFARQYDYLGFYEQEMEFRRQLSYPPITHIIICTFVGHLQEKVEFVGKSVEKILRAQLPSHVIMGDLVPAPIAKLKSFYRYQIVLRSIAILKMSDYVRHTLKDHPIPKDIKVIVDVDPLQLG
ncbi:MAG: primosomal protein N' [Verrucomicrobiota bacterium]|nr:primosomal protein N' [Verrucomicrobiota bacterium]